MDVSKKLRARGWNAWLPFQRVWRQVGVLDKGIMTQKDVTDLYQDQRSTWHQLLTKFDETYDIDKMRDMGQFSDRLISYIKSRDSSFSYKDPAGATKDWGSWQEALTNYWTHGGRQKAEERGVDTTGWGATVSLADTTTEPTTVKEAAQQIFNNMVGGENTGGAALGHQTATGQYSRGVTHNYAGAELDTQTISTTKGDVITQGSESVDTATKTLRPSYVIAGGEHVRPDEATNLQSDTLFEAFSWVPDGYGQGPDNKLHLMNKQHEHLRFGMEPLSEPRQLVDVNMTHPLQPEWHEAMPREEITHALVEPQQKAMFQEDAVLAHENQPLKVLDDDYNRMNSFKDLPRQVNGPSPFSPIVDNTRRYLSQYDPSGMIMSKLGYQDNMKGTWRYRRELTLGKLT